MNLTLEKKLVASAKTNREDFTILYRETVTDVYRFIYSLARNREIAEDVTSRTYLQALKNINTYEFRGRPFKAWLFTISRNLLYSEYHKEKNVHSIDDEFETSPAQEDNNDINVLIKEYEIDHIRKVLTILPKEAQEIIYLKTEEDLTFEEIANIQGITLSTAKMRFYRAIERIRQNLSISPEEPDTSVII